MAGPLPRLEHRFRQADGKFFANGHHASEAPVISQLAPVDVRHFRQ